MRSVAAAAAAFLLASLTACAPDRPAVPDVAETSAPAGESGRSRSFPSHAAAPDGEARDAREAAEEAARRILDVTVLAASRIREVGAGAVQTLLPSRGEDAATAPDDAPAGD